MVFFSCLTWLLTTIEEPFPFIWSIAVTIYIRELVKDLIYKRPLEDPKADCRPIRSATAPFATVSVWARDETSFLRSQQDSLTPVGSDDRVVSDGFPCGQSLALGGDLPSQKY